MHTYVQAVHNFLALCIVLFIKLDTLQSPVSGLSESDYMSQTIELKKVLI